MASLSPSDIPGLVKVTMKPTRPGTPMKQVIHPAVAWGIGAAPFPPTPMERHVEVSEQLKFEQRTRRNPPEFAEFAGGFLKELHPRSPEHARHGMKLAADAWREERNPIEVANPGVNVLPWLLLAGAAYLFRNQIGSTLHGLTSAVTGHAAALTSGSSPAPAPSSTAATTTAPAGNYSTLMTPWGPKDTTTGIDSDPCPPCIARLINNMALSDSNISTSLDNINDANSVQLAKVAMAHYKATGNIRLDKTGWPANWIDQLTLPHGNNSAITLPSWIHA